MGTRASCSRGAVHECCGCVGRLLEDSGQTLDDSLGTGQRVSQATSCVVDTNIRMFAIELIRARPSEKQSKDAGGMFVHPNRRRSIAAVRNE